MQTIKGLNLFEIRIDNIANCAIADKNRSEVEIQFHENDNGIRDEDSIVQIRFHFPDPSNNDDDDENPEESLAEEFQDNITKYMTKSDAGNIIVEFDKDEGTFVTPRGRYGIQVSIFI